MEKNDEYAIEQLERAKNCIAIRCKEALKDFKSEEAKNFVRHGFEMSINEIDQIIFGLKR